MDPFTIPQTDDEIKQVPQARVYAAALLLAQSDLAFASAYRNGTFRDVRVHNLLVLMDPDAKIVITDCVRREVLMSHQPGARSRFYSPGPWVTELLQATHDLCKRYAAQDARTCAWNDCGRPVADGELMGAECCKAADQAAAGAKLCIGGCGRERDFPGLFCAECSAEFIRLSLTGAKTSPRN